MTFPVLLIVGSVAAADMTRHDGSVGIVNNVLLRRRRRRRVAFGRAMDRSRTPSRSRRLVPAARDRPARVCGLCDRPGRSRRSSACVLVRDRVRWRQPRSRGRRRHVRAVARRASRRDRPRGRDDRSGGEPVPDRVPARRGPRRALDPTVLPWSSCPSRRWAFACTLSLRPDPRDLAVAAASSAPAGPAERRRELLSRASAAQAVLAAAVGQMAMVAVMGVTPVALCTITERAPPWSLL